MHYAKIENNIVTKVIVAEAEFFDTFVDDSPGEWLQTSYNNNIRKNFAGIGFTYDVERDAFISPKPYNSWALDEDTCQWIPYVPYPTDGKDYGWDESTTNWTEVV